MYTEQPSVEVSKLTVTDVKTKITDKALMKKTAFRMMCKKLNLVSKIMWIDTRLFLNEYLGQFIQTQ